ncbi:hypothetical protein CH370_09755 [Leptospira kmetyi]|uniref:hypothetical protein n=1 Tax=Leptospira kmetyi TaxID=408139 RepID=UPI000C29B75B|nr:hypothetical protein [Leptospira kmetyi]PJZ41710.1 hypothetical protein CH370_09755 [Leptospira kmetyi]
MKINYILTFPNRLSFQIIASLFISTITYFFIRNPENSESIKLLLNPANSVTILGVLSAIVTIAITIAYGHMNYFLTDANNRKIETYINLKERLFELENFILNSKINSEYINPLLRELYEILSIQLEGTAGIHWNESMEGVLDNISSIKGKKAQLFLQGLLARMTYCEELMNIIGVMSIKQIVTSVIIAPILKGFGILSLIIISGIGIFFLIPFPIFNILIPPVLIFISCLTGLLFYEVGFNINREVNEALDFVESNSNNDDQLEK